MYTIILHCFGPRWVPHCVWFIHYSYHDYYNIIAFVVYSSHQYLFSIKATKYFKKDVLFFFSYQ